MIGERVEEPGTHEDPEMPDSDGRARLDEDVEQAEEEERWNVLKVIQVIPSNALHIWIGEKHFGVAAFHAEC